MKLFIPVLLLATSTIAFSQGTLLFNNRVEGVLNAPMFANGERLSGARWTAQLYSGPSSGPLVPLFPTTTFDSGLPGFVKPVIVSVPGILSGQTTSLQMKIFHSNFPTYEVAPVFTKGVSSVFTITLGGGDLPPAVLTGLRPIDFDFDLNSVPEPSVYGLVLLGIAAIHFVRQRASRT